MQLLNAKQQKAVLLEGPVLVRAGPGTGKTKLLVEKIRTLIEDQGFPPHSLYVLSFTRDAASQIRARLSDQLEAEQAKAVHASTMHALAYRICRADTEMNLDPGSRRPRFLREGEGRDLLWEIVLRTVTAQPMINKQQAWNQVQRWKCGERKIDELPAWLNQAVALFQEQLATRKLWDISDLIPRATDILQVNNFLAAAFEIQYLCIDEFQDTSPAQYRFLTSLMGTVDGAFENLFVVGSEAQSIYSFRGADFSKLEPILLKEFPNLQTVILNQSYRSGRRIIQAAAAVVPQYEEVYLNSNLGEGSVYGYEASSPLAEANFVANQCRELHEKWSLEYEQIVILIRSWKQRGLIEKALNQAGIPYRISDQKREKFYKTRTVLAAVAYLRAIQALQADSIELERALDLILNVPERGIGNVSLRWIMDGQPEVGWNQLFAAMENRSIQPAVRLQLKGLVSDLLKFSRFPDQAPANLLHQVLERTGWWGALREDPFEADQVKSLEDLIQQAESFTMLDRFLESIKTLGEGTWDGGGLTLSTIHAAKGLEWPVVFLPGFEDGILPSRQAIQGRGDLEEEARLVHVALSRAMNLVMVSWTSNNGIQRDNQPSRFLLRLGNYLERFNPRTFHYQDLRSTEKSGPANSEEAAERFSLSVNRRIQK